jgi:16S rRNA (cytosine1402-N4)-methyltransferase
MTHTSVLLQTSIEGLDIKPGEIFVDGTLGGAGHSEEVIRRFGNEITVVGIDLDTDALERSKLRLQKLPSFNASKVFFKEGSFRNIDTILDELGFEKVQKILLDIGTSSFQIEESGRGFSFKTDEPLAMTLSKETLPGEVNARDVVNNWSEKSLSDIIYGFGEERYARKIANAIVSSREVKPIETSGELADIIINAVPASYRRGKIHPATRTFQAIRIAVNDELGALRDGVIKGFERLAPGGRMAVISFHSLEDRIVKDFFREMKNEGKATLLTKKPLTPSIEEISANPRSRSAKLRIISKI